MSKYKHYCVFEHAPYSVVTVLCISGGNWGKLVSPLLLQLTVMKVDTIPHVHSGGQDCAVDVCKPASSTSSTGRVTDQPYPAGDTGGQDTSHYVLMLTLWGKHSLVPRPRPAFVAYCRSRVGEPGNEAGYIRSLHE